MKSLMKLMIVISIGFLFFSTYVLENQNPQWKGTIEEENGVKVVKNMNTNSGKIGFLFIGLYARGLT